MTTRDDHWDTDDALATLVVDAVADVEPGDALAALRARTRTPARRRWVIPTLSAGLVAAAVVVAVAVLGNDEAPTAEPDPAPSVPTATQASPTAEPSSNGPGPESSGRERPSTTSATPQPGPGSTASCTPSRRRPAHRALELAVRTLPTPDYEMPWTDGVHASGSWDGNTITVDVTSPQTQDAGMGIVDRSWGMSEKQAALAVQQLVYTAQGVVDEGRVPVRFLVDGEPSSTVLGVPTVDPTRGAPPLDTLSLITLDRPQEGRDLRDR